MILTKNSKSRQENARVVATSVDVARLAGVTQATVSRAINKPGTVSPDTRRKVELAMASLNYKPSAAARILASGKNGVIGLMAHAEKYTSHRFGLLVEGITEVLAAEDYLFNVATLPPGRPVQEMEKSPLIKQHSCDGLLNHIDCAVGDLQNLIKKITVPCIHINPGTPERFDCVFPDDQGAAELAVNYLLSRGHRRIAFLTGSVAGHLPSLEARERGYEIAMYRAGLKPFPGFNARLAAAEGFEPQIQLLDPVRDARQIKALRKEKYNQRMAELNRLLDEWLGRPEPPTAVVTYDADGAISLLHAFYLKRWFVPDAISLIACDDEIPLERSVLPVTAVDLNRNTMGERATRMLLEKIAHPEKRIPSEHIEGTLIERMSVAAI